MKRIIKIPAAKFDKEPCKAKPTAKPTPPKAATKPEALKPNRPTTKVNTIALNNILRIGIKNVRIDKSTFRATILFSINLTSLPVTQKPIIKVNKAETKLHPTSEPFVNNHCVKFSKSLNGVVITSCKLSTLSCSCIIILFY